MTQAMAFKALKADVGHVRWASLLPRARTTGCRPTSSTSARTRGGRRSTAWWSWTSSPGRLLWSLYRTRTPKRSAGPPVARRGGQWSDHFKQAASAYNARPHEGGRRETAGHRVQGAARQRRQVPAQQGLDEPAHEGHRGRGGVSGAYQRGEELQPPVRQRAAAAGRGLHDRPEHRRPGDPAEAGAAGAPGQRQHGGPTDEAGQTGCGEAAGRLPGAQAAQKRFGPLTFLSRLDGSNMP